MSPFDADAFWGLEVVLSLQNILIFHQENLLTQYETLYNGTCVGGVPILRNYKVKGVLRPSVYWFARTTILLILAVPSIFAQQQKTAVPPDTSNTANTPINRVVAETNDRIAQLALASEVTQGDYVIGSGDLLAIEVFDVPELSREVRVNETGYISLPLMPTKVRVVGLNAFQLQDKLAELLQSNGLVSTPQVTVSVKEQHSQPITVIGAVKSPMVIQALRKTTLLQALSQAGGIAEDAGTTVIVTRPSSEVSESADPNDTPTKAAPQTFTISLMDVLESANASFNIPLIGGDVVSVPRAGIIYVVGAVGHPVGFLMQNDLDSMTMLKMLSLAGGATNTAKLKKAVILRKNPISGTRDQVPVDLSKILRLKSKDIAMQSNDILFVPDSNGLKALHRAGDVAVALTSGIGIVAAGKL
jgi:polysaccharide export outer membrane protein